MNIRVLALYEFTEVVVPEKVREYIVSHAKKDVLGTLILANEGINGTVCGSQHSLDELLKVLLECGFKNLEYKFSDANEAAFLRFKVICKSEIVTLGKDVNPCQLVGDYVEPKDWNELILQPDVLLIDTRNIYEYELGTFQGAVNPNTECFREFPDFVKTLDKNKYRKVAMFCTGGIRCEKASAYMLSEGFESVYHLKGGILKYLEEISECDSLWQGSCFVFDRRVAISHGLKLSNHVMCYACRSVLSTIEQKHQDYLEGVSCQYCKGELSTERVMQLQERQNQIVLAQSKGGSHFQGKTKVVRS
jgi:UPF0176 protein